MADPRDTYSELAKDPYAAMFSPAMFGSNFVSNYIPGAGNYANDGGRQVNSMWTGGLSEPVRAVAKYIPGAENFANNSDRAGGAIGTLGLSEAARGVGKALGWGGSKPYVAPKYSTGTTYGRPQDRFSMEGALTPSEILAPTSQDYYSDVKGAENVDAQGYNLDESGERIRRENERGQNLHSRNLQHNTDMAALEKQQDNPFTRWTDNNGSDVGGKSAYRYAWEQPSALLNQQQQAQGTNVTGAEYNALSQTPPPPSMNVSASDQPYSNSSTGQDWGYGGNDAVASYGDTQNPFYNANTQSYNDPSQMLWQNNSIPKSSSPLTDMAGRGTNSAGRY